MFGRRWRLFRLCGIPVSLDASWLIILALLTFSIARLFPDLMRDYFGDAAPVLPRSAYWLMGLIAAVAFFGCILLHEFGHAIVGRSRGMPIRGINLFLFGGVAELEDEPPSAATEFLMAIAGPVVSVILSICFALLTWAGYYGGLPPPVLMVLGYLAFINLLVLAFNMIPAFPLDGGRVLRSILWGTTGDLRRATYLASRAGQVFAWLLIFWGVMQIFAGNGLGGIWLMLIGLFLNTAAQGGYQQVLVRQVLHGEPVRRFMNSEPTVVPSSLDLLRWVEDFVYRYHHKSFPVVSDGRLEGLISTQALAGIPRAEWDQHTVGEVMRRDLQAITIPPDADALDALGRMRRIGSSRLLVVEQGHLVGVVSLKDLLRFLSLKIELEDSGPRGSELERSLRLPVQPGRVGRVPMEENKKAVATAREDSRGEASEAWSALDNVDEASDESFPASDPPANTPVTGVSSPPEALIERTPGNKR